eukprot:8700698-Pyramimonas_sp.AAC.2
MARQMSSRQHFPIGQHENRFWFRKMLGSSLTPFTLPLAPPLFPKQANAMRADRSARRAWIQTDPPPSFSYSSSYPCPPHPRGLSSRL